ncbi:MULTISPECIES: hypothetical protein [Yersinia pseudotuberculosis complex]|uniref:hypothetical protein n=1 Tax=Yersinia pseudotuberculosis complex TaxID=1649845 RepID=UPI0009070B85|nr:MULTISPECIES: hypothetical protein [Yersinia pseudotuberculosis complex]
MFWLRIIYQLVNQTHSPDESKFHKPSLTSIPQLIKLHSVNEHFLTVFILFLRSTLFFYQELFLRLPKLLL